MTRTGPVYDIGIVGLGPVAATLAALLAQSGLSVVVWEKELQPYPLPRAVHFDGEVMRVFQQVGIADDLASKLFVNLGMRFVDPQQKLLIDWPRPQEIGPHGWHASYRFHQPDLESALAGKLAELDNVSVLRGAQVVEIEDDADGVTVLARIVPSGAEERVRCKFVVGCDGARSFVRGWLGAELFDLQSNAQWLVVDVMMHRAVPELSDWTIQLCDPDRPTTIARSVGNRRRWEFMLMPGDDPARMTHEDSVWRLLSRWIRRADGEIERAAVYRFQAVIASSWRRGRVMIAGDAAHQTPPFLGQGLCAGVRDASNLAWKLDAVIHGGAEESILDTYQSERAPHVQEFVSQAVRVGRILQATAGQSAVHRDTVEFNGHEQMSTPAPRLGPGLHQSDDPWGGVLLGQPRLADGSLADSKIGQGWLLLVRPGLEKKAESLVSGTIWGKKLTVLPDRNELLGDSTVSGVLVRPDRYVLAGLQQIEHLPKLIARL